MHKNMSGKPTASLEWTSKKIDRFCCNKCFKQNKGRLSSSTKILSNIRRWRVSWITFEADMIFGHNFAAQTYICKHKHHYSW